MIFLKIKKMGRRPKQTFLQRRYTAGQCLCVYSIASEVRFFVIPWTVAPRLLCLWDFPGKSTGMGCHFFLQGIFSVQIHIFCIGRWILYHWAILYPGSQLLEKCKSKLEWGSTSHWSEWPSLKTLPTTSAGKGVGKRSPVTLLMGMLIGTASVENPQKTKNRVVIWSSSPTLGHILRTLNLKRYLHPYVR